MNSPHGARIGAQEPTHLAVPDGSPNARLLDVVDLAAMAGLRLDDWQQFCLDGATLLRPDGTWAPFEVAINVPRQNGKGSTLEARQLAGLFLFNERLQIHTAHEFKTCFEHFRRIKDLVEGCPSLVKQVKIIRTGAGDQAIELKNGNRIRFLARSRTSGRGFSGDVVYLDEAFELSEETIGALMPALSARPNPQIWYTSSAPHADSVVFHRIRRRALSGDAGRLFYAGWENPPDVDPLDRDAWYRSNPGLGIRIAEDFVANEQESMSHAEFARERLGIPEGGEGVGGPIDLDAWRDLGSASFEQDTSLPYRLALDVSPDRQWATIGVAGYMADGTGHVDYAQRDRGTAWVVPYLVEMKSRRSSLPPLVIDAGGPAGALIGELRAKGIEVDEVGVRDHAQACGAFLDAVLEGRVRHRNRAALNDAVAGARQRQSQDVWLWSRAGSAVDISPLVAVTLAWGKLPAPQRQVWAFVG